MKFDFITKCAKIKSNISQEGSFMNAIKKAAGLVPGFALALLIAAAAKLLESLLPIHLI